MKKVRYMPPLHLVLKDPKIRSKYEFDSTGKKLVKVDHRTSVYVPQNATKAEIDKIVNQYKRKNLKQ